MAKKTISKEWQLIKHDLTKIGIGALMAGLGAVMTYATQELANIDYGQWTPIITALLSILVNTIRKWMANTQY